MVTDQRLECQSLHLQQRVACRRQDDALDEVAWKGHEAGARRLARTDGEIRLAEPHQFDDFLRRALAQHEFDVRKAPRKFLQHGRQCVARLGMRRGDRQRAVMARREIAGDFREAVGVRQNASRHVYHRRAGLGQSQQPLGIATKELHPQFAFEAAQMATQCRLRCAERGRGARHAAVVAHDFDQGAELLEFHNDSVISMRNYSH